MTAGGLANNRPRDLQEVVDARERALAQRRVRKASTLRLGTVVIDFEGRRATQAGRDLGLSHHELKVLRYLADRSGQAVTRDDLLEAVWGYPSLPLTRSVDISIHRLRRKIEPDPRKPRYIRTLHGVGYCLVLKNA